MKRNHVKPIRGSLIAGLAFMLVYLTSSFVFWSVQDVYADIHWQSQGSYGTQFLETFEPFVDRVVFGGAVRLNSHDGYYLVMEADQDVSTLLTQVEQVYSNLPPENISIGRGDQGGFFTVKINQRMCACMLIRDGNTNKTLLFTLLAPASLFRYPVDPYVDQGGGDPVAELRPPGSTRVFCFEAGGLGFSAYRCMSSNLTTFYDNIFSTDEFRGISIASLADTKLPKNGNLFFFDTQTKKGIVTFQTSPEENCSYAIVCTQTK